MTGLVQRIPATITQAGMDPRDVRLELRWDAADPAVLTLAFPECEWEIARSTLIAAASQPMLGCWVGYLDYGVAVGNATTKLCFYPRGPRPVFVACPTVDLIDFVMHSNRLMTSHGPEETKVIGEIMDAAIERILAS